jgi:hypothetical protein
MKKYHEFAVGWLNQNDKGQYISGKANTERQKVKLLLQLEDGTQIEPTSFFVNISTEKKNEKAPDAKFTVTTEE